MSDESDREGPERLGWRVLDLSYLRDPHDGLAAFAYAVAALLLLAAMVMGGVLLWRTMLAIVSGQADEINKFLLSLAGLIGAPFVVWRVLIAAKQNYIAQETFHNTLFSKAIEQLGATREIKEIREVKNDGGHSTQETVTRTVQNTEVRLGAIYALEKLASDYEKLYWPIIETLCAYIRENAGKAKSAPDAVRLVLSQNFRTLNNDQKALLAKYREELKPLPVDVQAALTVIGRRSADRRALELKLRKGSKSWRAYRVDLRGTNLAWARLDGLFLEGAVLDGASLAQALLYQAQLSEANMYGAYLEDADLFGANLEGANLNTAHLEGASLRNVRLDGAYLNGAHLDGVTLLDNASLKGAYLNGSSLEAAELDGANLEGASLHNTSFKDASLADAVLTDAELNGADLSTAKNLTQAQIDSAWGDESTQIPPSLSRPTNERWESTEGDTAASEDQTPNNEIIAA